MRGVVASHAIVASAASLAGAHTLVSSWGNRQDLRQGVAHHRREVSEMRLFARRLMSATRRPSPWMIAMGLVAASIAIATATERAGAQVTAAPPLTGTTLQASENAGVPQPGTTIEITANCDLPQPEISWTATGVAIGTYSGPYTETGTATLTGTTGAFTFTAEFTIDSPLGFVSGTKGVTVQVGTGTCVRLLGFAGLGAMAPYTATITTATGTCTTEGMSTIIVQEQSGALIPFESFSETFDTGTVPVCTPACPPQDDEDGDGLNDSRESVFSTLLGNPDSDGDGIRDGDDDANGNGENDEDEDDDEEDGCPDDDSDDDGEDDEDEDDEEDDDDD